MVPVVPSVGALSKPIRSKLSTGTPVALFAGSMLPDATAKRGDAVTGTVRAFTSPVVADVCGASSAASEGDVSAVDPSVGDSSAEGPSAEDPSLTAEDPSVDGPSWIDPSTDPSMKDASAEAPSVEDESAPAPSNVAPASAATEPSTIETSGLDDASDADMSFDEELEQLAPPDATRTSAMSRNVKLSDRRPMEGPPGGALPAALPHV